MSEHERLERLEQDVCALGAVIAGHRHEIQINAAGLRALAESQEILMGQLEDIRDQETAAIAALGVELADLHAQLAADAANAPKPETVAALKALADKLTAMATPAAPAPSPAPAPEPPPAPPPAPPAPPVAA